MVFPTFEPLSPRPSAAQAATDILTLEYPALSEQINQTRTDGWEDWEIHDWLVEQEARTLYEDGYSQDEVDSYLGRTPEKKAELTRAMRKNEESAYFKIFSGTMDRKQITDMLRVSEISGVSPSLLVKYPELYKHAKDYAGRAASTWEYVGQAFVNLADGWKEGRFSSRAADISDVANEGPMTPERAARNMERARPDAERLQDDIRNFDAEVAERERIMPPDSVLGAFLLTLAGSAGFTLQSALTAGAGRAVGRRIGAAFGPAGIVAGGKIGTFVASLFNTNAEANIEAGSVIMPILREHMKKGSSFEEAFDAAFVQTRDMVNEVYRNNLILLGPANVIGDQLVFGTGAAGAKISKKIAMEGFAGKITRGILEKGLPLAVGAGLEGFEEGAQEIILSKAQNQPTDWKAVREAVKIGAASGTIYAGVGSAITRVADKLAQRGKKADAEIAEAVRTANGLASGEIKDGDIVGQDDFVFVDREAFDAAIAAGGKNYAGIREDYDLDEQTEDMEIGEYAIPKKDYAILAKEHPELAEAVSGHLREGVRGITAKERVRQAVHWANDAASSPLDADTPEAEAARRYAGEFRDSLAALDVDSDLAATAGSVYGHSLLAQSLSYGMSIDSLHRAMLAGR